MVYWTSCIHSFFAVQTSNNNEQLSDECSSSEDEFENVKCHVCGSNTDCCPLEKPSNLPQDVVLCDGKDCGKGFHFRCHEIPLFSTPTVKQWFCFDCQVSKYKRKKRDGDDVISTCRTLAKRERTLKTKLVLSELKRYESALIREWNNLSKMEDIIRTFKAMAKTRASSNSSKFEFDEVKHAKRKAKKYRGRILDKLESMQAFIKSNPRKEPRFDDESSEISASDMICSFCRVSSSSDNNDVFLCDHNGCGRMMHLECFGGILENMNDDEDSNWFCPFCETVSLEKQLTK